ncbi:MAG: hypothetical protein EXS06_10390 [Planctomycetaceae bacterium]|nr:hypothetical protein [Planctomycetaceae bacterium]
MAQAQADADFGIAGAIAGATAGNAAAAAGSAFSAAASKAAGDLTRALNAVQTGFVDAATAAGVKATRTIAAAETVERKAFAKANVVLAKYLQAACGTYAAVECGAVTLNARERATIGADFEKEVAGAELAAVKAVAPARKTSMVATAEANGVYHVKVKGIVADLGILGGEIKVEATKAKALSISAWLGKKAHGLWDTANDVVVMISKSYDAISMAAHTALSGFGVIPGFGIVPDLADLALTAIEIPFGKSDGKDFGLATLGVFTTVAPGPVDGLAAGAKIGTRMAKAAAKVADGAGAAGKGLDRSLAVGQRLSASVRVTGGSLAAMRKEFARVKPQAWIDEAASNPSKYTSAQLEKMRNGLAPIGKDGFPMEIHHQIPLAEGGTKLFSNFSFLTRTLHRLGSNYKINHPNLL